MISQFIGNIYGPVEAGHIFVIAGKTLDGASRLEINFKSGKNEDASIVLHLSCRFYDDIIVRNSKTSNGWDVEEREENLNEFTTPNPIVAGDNFRVYILVGDARFYIAINDQPYCVFDFRLPNELIRTIEVTRDVQSVNQIDHRSAYPSPWPLIQKDMPYVVFSSDVPRQFSPGHVIIITAIPSGNPRGAFVIYFTEGATDKDILHFNPRFEPNFVIVRNAMNDALEFGTEERDGVFPFAFEEQFKLAIGIANNSFKFSVNGRYFGSFSYRTANPLKLMNGLKISTRNGLHLSVTEVDHLNTENGNCEGIDAFSHPDNYVT